MYKKHKLEKSLFKPVVCIVLTLYALSTITLLLSLPDTLPHKWMNLPLFTLDYPLRLIMPTAAFIIGYFATNSNKRWSRLYDGALFLVAYWWFQTLLFGISIYFIGMYSSLNSSLIETLLPNIGPIVLLGLYAIHLSRKSKQNLPSIGKEFTITTIIVVFTCILLQLAYIISAFFNNDLIFNNFTASSNTTTILPPFLFTILVIIGYYLFQKIKQPRIQIFLSIMAITPYVFSAYVWIYLFGSMPSETWLIIIGNVVGLSATAYLFYRMREIT